MNFRQFYLGCLSHASYYLGSDHEAAIIDPQRDVQQYLDEAAANGQRIKYIIETHSHADFVSGHVELAAKKYTTSARRDRDLSRPRRRIALRKIAVNGNMVDAGRSAKAQLCFAADEQRGFRSHCRGRSA